MRADFYLIAKPRFRDEPLRLVCELVRKAHDANLPTLVLARDREQAELLDDLLWDMGDDAFIPHQIAGLDPDEDGDTPVLIASPEYDPPMRPLPINLRAAAVAGGFVRVLVVVPAHPAPLGPLLERCKQFRPRALHVQMDEL